MNYKESGVDLRLIQNMSKQFLVQAVGDCTHRQGESTNTYLARSSK